jgi:hypothetical protein
VASLVSHHFLLKRFLIKENTELRLYVIPENVDWAFSVVAGFWDSPWFIDNDDDELVFWLELFY